ncbi:molecular chaperone HtpG [Buchnera aphidicola]|uniref:Chaperone protein HtpG n=1 Tax=Buchnera aphidicola subsp. Cinara cedri (strain Cc) TaxID=372461 RepID=HTPG_BUCCC|nr:molecular chaperone HtpG [Buchnera aphidicola]Q057D9.1 RecName: Full=Chaperone protein HtpG; AltName: Full=Heat shock protein HtpG; AltName: Full=High temperature protein G [Buchnera aphidicola BCc]ABJ90760.1 chaperone Hsp90 [Buchnera aphidicola BCc]
MNNKNKITHTFQSEVKELLHLMIHSLYSNKEIFLRELISNASDAIEKIRFEKLYSLKKYRENLYTPKIKISIKKDEKKIIISDNGIGMTYKEVIKNLGTIAKSGTKSFLNKIQNIEKKEKNDFIGQFGVGFYSSFIVSNSVSVYTRHAKEKKNIGTLWISEGKGKYSVEKISKEEHGTIVELSLKSSEKEFLEIWKIKNIIKKYSDHISIPIEIENYDEKTKTISWEKINKAQALWTINKNNITKKKYQDFYKYLTNDSEKPLLWSHNKVEGTQEYINLLYIPKKATWDIWHQENKHGLKLYVKHVFIMDEATQFLPNYLRFVKGIIDSQDLPLNISREILQDSSITHILRKSLTKRILNILNNLSENNIKKYQKFWNVFGIIIKEGIAEDSENKTILSNLLRFSSIKKGNIEQTLSLNEYIKNMKKNQKKIYFITSDSYKSALNSPNLEIFKENDIDVLILSEKIDEWMMNYLTEFNNIKFQSVSKLDDTIDSLLLKKNVSNEKNTFNEFIEKTKKILKNKVKDVKITYRLKNTPAIVLTDTNDMSTQMAKIFSAAGQPIPKIKYILEINPLHPLIKKIEKIKNEKDFSNWIKIIFDQSILSEKGSLENPHKFIQRINNFFIS